MPNEFINESVNKSIAEQESLDSSRKFGIFLLIAGVTTMVITGVLALPWSGGAMAAAFFAVIIGLILRFPTLIQDGTNDQKSENNASTMRIAVILIISVFSILLIKTGWSAQTIADLKIDSTWIGILGVVLGGKVFQSFAENQGPKVGPR